MVQGIIVQGAVESCNLNQNIMPNQVIVNFEDENGDDVAGAMQEAMRTMSRQEWADDDIPFYSKQIETRMKAAGVTKNYTKFQLLSMFIPKKVQDEVKSLLIKEETEFANNDSYKQLKHEILRIFGPKPNAAIDRALGRTLTGLPSQLCRALINDICKKNLVGCQCCPAVVECLWKRQLSSSVRAGIAHCTFNADTAKATMQLADDIWASNPAPQSVAAVLDETQPAIPYATPEVAAIRGRGGRGGRGRGGRGGRGGQRGAANNGSGTSSGPKHKGTKHPDLPQGEWKGCSMHFRWGRSAHFCSEPSSCPRKDIFTPKPAKNQ